MKHHNSNNNFDFGQYERIVKNTQEAITYYQANQREIASIANRVFVKPFDHLEMITSSIQKSMIGEEFQTFTNVAEKMQDSLQSLIDSQTHVFEEVSKSFQTISSILEENLSNSFIDFLKGIDEEKLSQLSELYESARKNESKEPTITADIEINLAPIEVEVDITADITTPGRNVGAIAEKTHHSENEPTNSLLKKFSGGFLVFLIWFYTTHIVPIMTELILDEIRAKRDEYRATTKAPIADQRRYLKNISYISQTPCVDLRYITKENLRVFMGPSTRSGFLTIIKFGEPVEVLEKETTGLKSSLRMWVVISTPVGHLQDILQSIAGKEK